MEFNSTHKHGGNPEADFQRFEIAEKPVIDFSVNTSPLGPPPEIKEIWLSLYEEIKRYPSIIYNSGNKSFSIPGKFSAGAMDGNKKS